MARHGEARARGRTFWAKTAKYHHPTRANRIPSALHVALVLAGIDKEVEDRSVVPCPKVVRQFDLEDVPHNHVTPIWHLSVDDSKRFFGKVHHEDVRKLILEETLRQPRTPASDVENREFPTRPGG